MGNLHENFAAIAVIGELYESGKDMYDVLAAYLQIIIQTEQLANFTSVDITEKINRTNSFHVNEAIVKTALKRLNYKRENGVYSLDGAIRSVFDEHELEEHTRQNQAIVNSLFSYIAQETGSEISTAERNVIENQFYRYLKDPEHEESYSMLISKFLMTNSLSPSFHEAISRIKEGLLVYEGICFSPEVGQSGKWEFPLNVFLELEVLFFIAGYNGEIHKDIYGQLIDYVDEINILDRARKNKLVNLYYTSDVQAEIESYFSTAESIFERHEIVDPSKKAMLFILDNVTSKHEIQMKKVQFYNYLVRKGITEFKADFFSEENRQFNSITENTYTYNIAHVGSEKGEEYIIRCTDKVNQINILRKGKNSSLRDAGYVLLTANGTILRCAYMPNAYSAGDTPKAVNLDYLINRFWYKLNKGFGKGDSPKSIDIISRAQMVLSSMTVSKVSQTYDDIKQKYAEGLISDMEVAGILGELRRISKNPEDITSEQIDEQIAFLTDYDLSKKIEDIRREELARQHDRETITHLKLQLDENEKQRLLDEQARKERESRFEERIAALEKKNSQTERDKQELERVAQAFIDRDNRIRLTCKKIIRGTLFVFGVAAICVALFLLCRLILRVDKSISGIISIVISIAFQFLPPIKNLWKRYVIDCKLKEKK